MIYILNCICIYHTRYKMLGDEGIVDMEPLNIKVTIQEINEKRRIDNLVSSLYTTSDIRALTTIYTNILCDDNVSEILSIVSKQECFLKHFPEFYVKNIYGENVFNCSQNSEYHRYGVFKHILRAIEEVGKGNMSISDSQKKILKWSMLLHDIGKPYVKIITDETKESFADHDNKSFELATNILERFYFTDDEKKVILTLIKFHDKFLNEGEIIYDNLKILAEELENKREYFYLLIDVKDSDACAKSIDVYNKYKLTKSKYLEFSNSYFENSITTSSQSIIDSSESDIINGDNTSTNDIFVDLKDEEISDVEYENIINDILDRKRLCSLYQPIIDIDNKCVFGYETLTKIEYSKKIDIQKFLKFAEKTSREDRVEQILFINCIESFESISIKEANKLFLNINLESYEKYVNKPRIYDSMNKNKVTLELHGYEKYDLTSIQEFINMIHDNSGCVCFDHFGIGTFKMDDLNLVNPDYIKLDKSVIDNIKNDLDKQKYITELQTYCLSKDTKLIVVGVETLDIYNLLIKLGVKYMQGYYLAYPSNTIEILNENLQIKLSNTDNDSIV